MRGIHQFPRYRGQAAVRRKIDFEQVYMTIESTFAEKFQLLIVDDTYYLREHGPDDVRPFFTYYSDPEVSRYILAHIPTNLEEAKSEVLYCRNLFYTKRGIFWTLAERKTNLMIGAIGLYINTMHRRGEIGYDLARAHWGHGIMTRAMETVIQFTFQTLDLVRIEAVTLHNNAASISLLKRLHFQAEGTLHNYRVHQGKAYDVEMFALCPDVVS